jgi:hypothetical protein
VVYFADDDNTYDIRLFKEIATTQRISMFPVGFIGSQGMVHPQSANVQRFIVVILEVRLSLYIPALLTVCTTFPS